MFVIRHMNKKGYAISHVDGNDILCVKIKISIFFSSSHSFDIYISLIIFQIFLYICLRKNSKIFDVEYFAEGAINIVFCSYRRHFYDPSYNIYYNTKSCIANIESNYPITCILVS